jgi:putative membrane protein
MKKDIKKSIVSKIISSEELYQVSELITESEKRTDSELVPMIVDMSDLYPAAHFRAAIITSFLFSLALYFSPLSIINPIYYLWIQIPGLLVGYFLAHVTFVKRWLTFEAELECEVKQRALEAFFEHNLHSTQNNNGVLIFISLMERKIKIITDIAVKEKIKQEVWDQIVHDFTDEVKKSTLVGALKKTIEASTHVLESYFPADSTQSKKKNELKNELIVE